MRTSWWAWPALGGIVVGLALLARAGLGMLAALPVETRAAVQQVLKRRVRVLSVGGVVLLWTIVYALYSMTLPADIDTRPGSGTREVAARTPARVRTTTPPIDVIPGLPVAPPSAAPLPTAAPGAPPATPTLPPAAGGPTQEPCSVEAQSALVRELQGSVEALLGAPVGADFALLVDAIAGCSDAASAALALLGPVNQILNQIGILPETIDLPDTQPIVLPTIPEPIAAPLRPTVFDACAEASRQLVTVGALSIFLHLDYNDLVAVFNNVDAVCTAFAPA